MFIVFAFFIACVFPLYDFFLHSLHSGLNNLYPLRSNASVPEVFPVKSILVFIILHLEHFFSCVFAHSYSSSALLNLRLTGGSSGGTEEAHVTASAVHNLFFLTPVSVRVQF